MMNPQDEHEYEAQDNGQSLAYGDNAPPDMPAMPLPLGPQMLGPGMMGPAPGMPPQAPPVAMQGYTPNVYTGDLHQDPGNLRPLSIAPEVEEDEETMLASALQGSLAGKGY